MDYVYLWADGIHVSIRLEEHKLCLLVMIGVRADGRKELIAWPMATGSGRSRGRTCCAIAPPRHASPVLAIGDGALGFWGALREVFPGAREGRCWFHKTANVLAALPKRGRSEIAKRPSPTYPVTLKPSRAANLRRATVSPQGRE